MTIIKLHAGESVPMSVRAVAIVPSQFGQDCKFTGRTPTDDDAAIFLKPESAERQLKRLGMTMDTVVGQIVEFAKPGKFIDINRYVAPGAAPAAAQPALALTPAAPAAPPPKPAANNAKQPFSLGPDIPGIDTPDTPAAAALADPLVSLFAVYDRCLAHAVQASRTLGAVPVTHEGVSAMTSTLFIAAGQRRSA